MAISWVAEKKAIAPAAAMVSTGVAAASDSASASAAKTSHGCTASSQPRRRPKRASTPGGATWSSTGAHRNFSVYGRPMLAVSPMAASETWPSVSHWRRVKPESDNGRPDTKPNASISHSRRSAHRLSAATAASSIRFADTARPGLRPAPAKGRCPFDPQSVSAGPALHRHAGSAARQPSRRRATPPPHHPASPAPARSAASPAPPPDSTRPRRRLAAAAASPRPVPRGSPSAAPADAPTVAPRGAPPRGAVPAAAARAAVERRRASRPAIPTAATHGRTGHSATAAAPGRSVAPAPHRRLGRMDIRCALISHEPIESARAQAALQQPPPIALFRRGAACGKTTAERGWRTHDSPG